jgi:hypothetical protein
MANQRKIKPDFPVLDVRLKIFFHSFSPTAYHACLREAGIAKVKEKKEG